MSIWIIKVISQLKKKSEDMATNSKKSTRKRIIQKYLIKWAPRLSVRIKQM